MRCGSPRGRRTPDAASGPSGDVVPPARAVLADKPIRVRTIAGAHEARVAFEVLASLEQLVEARGVRVEARDEVTRAAAARALQVLATLGVGGARASSTDGLIRSSRLALWLRRCKNKGLFTGRELRCDWADDGLNSVHDLLLFLLGASMLRFGISKLPFTLSNPSSYIPIMSSTSKLSFPCSVSGQFG